MMSNRLPPHCNHSPVAFDFVIVCWGPSYTRLLLDVCLPSLLASGNLPAISSLSKSRFCIYTTDIDAVEIRQSAAFAALQRLMPVNIHFPQGLKGDRYEKMSSCHRHAIAEAESRKSAIVCLGPDLIMANGSLAAISRLADSGYRVVLCPGLSLIAEEAAPVFTSMADSSACSIAISSHDLFDFGINCLHPRTLMQIWGSGSNGMLPSNLYWRVDGEGLIGRCFHLSPLMVNPRVKSPRFNSTIDIDFALGACPDPRDWYTIADSDELMFCEVSSSDRKLEGMRKDSIEDVISFAEILVSREHVHNASTVVRLHGKVQTEKKWIAAAVEMDLVMNQIIATLKRSSSELLLSDPLLLLRRLRRIAVEMERAKNARLDIATLQLNRFERLAGATVGRLLNQAYSTYARFIFRYFPIRTRIGTLIYGEPPRLRLWHWQWLERRRFYSACSAVLTITAGSNNLFVLEAGYDENTNTSGLETRYLLPQNRARAWPFIDSQFSNVRVLLPLSLTRHDIDHILAEATRVLKPGGGLVMGGLPSDYLNGEQLERARTALTAMTIQPQGNRGSAACARLSNTLQAILKRIPGRLALEILLFPLVIGGSVLVFGVLNALGCFLDLFDKSHQSELGIVLSARKRDGV
jgi:SAM-dependent methyltransferase